MKTVIATLTLLLTLTCAYAEEGKYDICYATGYFAGEDDKFMLGLAMRDALDRGVFLETVCKSAYGEAYDIGEKFSTTGKVESDHQLKIMEPASNYRLKVNRAIIKLIE